MTDEERCRHCGRSLAPSAQYCGGCGRPVTGTGPPTMSIRTTPAPDPYADEFDDDYDDDSYGGRRRVVPLAIAAVVVIAAIVAAAVVMTRSKSPTHPAVTAATRPTGPIVMPSVVTFTRAQAVSQLEGAGVAARSIKISARPRVDVVPGTVLAQQPPPGITVTRPVVLVVSKAPSTLPNFVGQGINAARVTLSTLNVSLTMRVELNSTVADGTVLQQLPRAGAPFVKSIVLIVARTPVTTTLGDLTAIGTAPKQSDTETIAGTAFDDSLVWTTSACPGALPIDAKYELGGHYRVFKATVGLGPETQDPGTRVHLDLKVDGTIVFVRDLTTSSAAPIVLDVTKHHELELTFVAVPAAPGPTLAPAPGTPPGTPACSATIVLGRAQLLSTVGDITAPAS